MSTFFLDSFVVHWYKPSMERKWYISIDETIWCNSRGYSPMLRPIDTEWEWMQDGNQVPIFLGKLIHLQCVLPGLCCWGGDLNVWVLVPR